MSEELKKRVHNEDVYIYVYIYTVYSRNKQFVCAYCRKMIKCPAWNGGMPSSLEMKRMLMEMILGLFGSKLSVFLLTDLSL